MSDGSVLFEVVNGTAIITLNRPSKLNALDRDLMAQLSKAFDQVEMNEAISVTILTGSGRAFCAGGDIKDWGALTPREFGYSWVRQGHRLFDRLAQLRMPVIAALNGNALGGGFELAACADIRIAGADIKVGLPETSIGVVPGWSGTQRLVKRFGYSAIARMVLGGELFDATEAKSLGLVDLIAEKSPVLDKAMEYAANIQIRSQTANEISKLMLLGAVADGGDAAVEALGSILSAKTADRDEGVQAFSAKRIPYFKGHGL